MLARAFALLAALVAPRIAAADCASVGLVTTVATPANATLPADGGVVVIATYDRHGSFAAGDRAVHPEWRLRDGAARVAPTIDAVAPGLAVYRLGARAGKPGPIELEDDHHAVVATVAHAEGKRAALAAPVVKALVYRAQLSRHGGTTVTATLDRPPPADAYALVIADAKGGGRSWTPVVPGALDQTPYAHEGCAALPNGTVGSVPGDKVVLFWVDAGGRRSAASAPIAVTGSLEPVAY